MKENNSVFGKECREPMPIDLAILRDHFRSVYKLNEDQVELMIQSSVKSLCAAFSAAEEALKQGDIYTPLGQVGHSLKGLFLNMGENEWAEMARSLEQSAKARQECDFTGLIRKIRRGVARVTEYESGG